MPHIPKRQDTSMRTDAKGPFGASGPRKWGKFTSSRQV
jgi:hypothetical protein